jgi:hypothetical protein
MMWIKSARYYLETTLYAHVQRLLALVIDSRWSNATLTLILNEHDESKRKELINSWVHHRYADLERINITVSPSSCQL